MIIHRNVGLSMQQDFAERVLPFINTQNEVVVLMDGHSVVGWFVETRKVVH